MSDRRIPGINIFYSFSLPLWKQLALTLLGVLLALIVTTVMRPVITGATLLPFTAAVAFGAYLAGVRGAVLAAVTGYVLVEYFFVNPVGVLFPEPDNYLRAILFVLVGAFIGWLQQQWRIAWLAQKSTRDELESILTAAADGIMMLDPSLHVLYANPQAQKLLGLSAPLTHGGPLLPRLDDELQFCDELEAALTTEQLPFRKAAATGRVGDAIFGCGPKSGAIDRWISVKAAPVLDDKRRVKSVIAVFTDYSAQRRSLKKAQDERDRLHSIFEVMSDAVIVSDQDGVLDMLNASAEKLIGISAADARGHMMTEIYSLEPAEAAGILLADVSSDVGARRLPSASWARTADGEQIPVSGSVMVLPERMGKVVILRDLREEAMLERQRLQSEQRLRDMIANIVCQVALVDSTGRLLEYNGGRADSNGNLPMRGERQPFPVDRIQDAADQLPPVVLDSFERALRGELVRLDLEVPIDDQEPRSFDMQVAPLYDDTGHISNVVFSAVEITDRKQAQKMTAALAQLVNAERKRLEDIIEGIPAIVWESAGRPGHDHRITFVNHYTEQVLGLSLEDWSKREHPWESIMHPEDAEEAMRQMQARFDGTADAPGAPIQFRVSTSDGTVLELEMRLIAIRDENGQPIGMRGIALDITPQKEAERRIGQLMKLVEIGRKRLQDTIDAVPAIVWEAVGPPETQRMVFVSNYAETLSGYTAQEWVDVPGIGTAMIVPEDYDAAMATVERNYFEDAGLPVHYRLRRKDGQIRWVESRVSMVKDSDGKPIGVRGVTTDITELRQVEAELRRSNEELQQFAYVASHDLQEPLRMVTSYLQLIEQRYADQLDEQAHEFIDFAVGGATRMKQLINDLLAYSRVQTNREAFKPVDVSALVDSVLANLGSQIEETGAMVERDPLPTVRGNATLLTQLFQNLLNNALKFHGDNAPKIEVRVERNGPMWQFAVRDNGIGLDPRYADRIFVLFQRLHSQTKYSGTGIGLTICKKVVESHAGEIWVESQPGQGATFFFTLPATMNGEYADAE
jgi:PAS domain S-box-containing protein